MTINWTVREAEETEMSSKQETESRWETGRRVAKEK